MIINLSPVRGDNHLFVEVNENAILINGDSFDFSQMQDGDTLPRDAISSPWFAGDVKRIAGVLHLTLVFPHGPHAGEAARFPASITIDRDGPVQLPESGHSAPPQQEPAEEEAHEQH